jgi:imidazole glycerol-phosphate synthase subunit HisH
MKKITLLDYGMGNVQSLYNAIKFLGYEPEFFSETRKISSDICFIPGVGAFNHAMELLKKENIFNKILEFSKNQNNMLIGICLGMQILFEESTENTSTKGLDLIKGKVVKLSEQKKNRLPNVGWHETFFYNDVDYKYLNQFNNEKFYYIHSYKVMPKNMNNIIAHSIYDGSEFCSISTNRKNVIGVQFHPEKSGDVGLEFLRSLIISK